MSLIRCLSGLNSIGSSQVFSSTVMLYSRGKIMVSFFIIVFPIMVSLDAFRTAESGPMGPRRQISYTDISD